jgi:hypothetical protein
MCTESPSSFIRVGRFFMTDVEMIVCSTRNHWPSRSCIAPLPLWFDCLIGLNYFASYGMMFIMDELKNINFDGSV